MEFSRALLPKGGELEIEAGLQEIGGERYVVLKVASSSATSLEVEEKDAFRPFLRVNNHQVGLGITLAHQILRRHQGNILFRKENPQRGLFTILLKVRSQGLLFLGLDEEGAPAGSKRKRGVHGFIT
jgi:K+-sensing histidine kinase KdpD